MSSENTETIEVARIVIANQGFASNFKNYFDFYEEGKVQAANPVLFLFKKENN
jgi:hypothetical protein